MYYANAWLDRSGRNRKDPAWIAARLDHPATRIVPYWQGRSLVREAAAGLRAVTLDRAALDMLDPAPDGPILLGLDGDTAFFAVGLAGDQPPLIGGSDPGTAFLDLRAAAARLGARDAAMLAYGKAMLYWHSRHRFCGICGQPTIAAEAGHVRVCAGCAVHHFPRTDGAVIMLVTDGDKALLGRQPSWPTGMYSVLAGFVEPGESLEAAVAREVLEEAGIEIANCRYYASQPWPFPGSLMLGFRADAVTREIRIDPEELEDARWVSRDWLRANADSDTFRMPPPGAIARAMVEAWLAEG